MFESNNKKLSGTYSIVKGKETLNENSSAEFIEPIDIYKPRISNP
jgi:hypothetical protein